MSSKTTWIIFTVMWLGFATLLYSQHDNTSNDSTIAMIVGWACVSVVWWIGDSISKR